MLIFKKLDKAIQTINNNLSILELDDTKRDIEENKLKTLKLILKYIKSCEWLKHDSSKNKIKTFLNNNYDYRLTCEQLNISLHCLENTVSYANKKLENRIGTRTIDMIMEGNLVEAILRFSIAAKITDISALFVQNIMSILPAPKNSSFIKISDCLDELSFLLTLTQSYIEKQFNSKNTDKLAFILYVLSRNDNCYSRERVLIFQLLSCKISLDQFKTEILLNPNKNIYMD